MIVGGFCDEHILHMGLRFRNQGLADCFFVTTSFHRHRRLGDLAGVYAVLAQSLAFCVDKYDARLPAYVFMPSHIHLLVVVPGKCLAGFMRDFKKYTAQKGLPACGVSDASVWQNGYDRVAVYSERIFRQKLEYIHRNPVKAGLADREQDWVWSSASAYLEDTARRVPVWKDWLF